MFCKVHGTINTLYMCTETPINALLSIIVLIFHTLAISNISIVHSCYSLAKLCTNKPDLSSKGFKINHLPLSSSQKLRESVDELHVRSTVICCI